MELLAIEWGIPAEKYWLMTFEEIMLQVSANKNRRKNETKEKAMFDYNLAQLISFAFNQPEKMPKANEVYSILEDKKEERTQNLVSEKDLQATYNSDSDQALFMEIAKGVQRFNQENER